MPMEAFKENDTGGRILGGGATGGEWTGRGACRGCILQLGHGERRLAARLRGEPA